MRMCQDGCDEGRKPCPHPHLCDGWEPVDLTGILIRLLWPVAFVAVIAGAVALWRAFA